MRARNVMISPTPAQDTAIHGTAGLSVTSATYALLDPNMLAAWLAVFAALVSISLGLQKWWVIWQNSRRNRKKRRR